MFSKLIPREETCSLGGHTLAGPSPLHTLAWKPQQQLLKCHQEWSANTKHPGVRMCDAGRWVRSKPENCVSGVRGTWGWAGGAACKQLISRVGDTQVAASSHAAGSAFCACRWGYPCGFGQATSPVPSQNRNMHLTREGCEDSMSGYRSFTPLGESRSSELSFWGIWMNTFSLTVPQWVM